MKNNLAILFVFLTAGAYTQEALTLPEAVKIGLKNNYSIILQQNDLQIAKNNNTAGAAGFLPTLNWTANQNNTINSAFQRSFTGTEKSLNNARNTSFNTGLQLSWTVFDGLNMFANRDILDLMQKVGENQSRVVVENTVSDIALSYYNIVQLQKSVKVSEDAVALSLTRKKFAEAKASLGSGSQLAVLQSTVDLNADSAVLINARVAVKDAIADLNRLLARDVTIPVTIMDSIKFGEGLNYNNQLTKALSQNSGLIDARMNRDVAVLNIKSAESVRYPRVNLQSTYGYNLSKSQTGFAEYSRGYGPSFGVSASYTIFNGFKTNQNIKNAKILAGSGQLEYQQAELDLRNELYKMFNDYQTAVELVKFEVQNVAVAGQNVDIAFAKYKLGTFNDLELRDTQKKLIDVQYRLLQSQFQAKTAEIGLLKMSGDLVKMF